MYFNDVFIMSDIEKALWFTHTKEVMASFIQGELLSVTDAFIALEPSMRHMTFTVNFQNR